MIDLRVTASAIDVHSTEDIVSGSVGIYQVCFTFDAAWDNLTRTAVFACGNTAKSVLLGNDECSIPWEVLDHKNVLKPLVVGVYGTNGDGTIVRPTMYGVISQSVAPGTEVAESGIAPSPTIYQQMLNLLRSTEQIAQSVRDDANNGAFTPVFSVGTVTTGEAGSAVQIEQTGDVLHPVLNFIIPKGDKGDKGDTGSIGSKGDKGDKGDTGAQGIQGIQGIQGAKGDKGDKGETGDNTLVDVNGGATYRLGLENGIMFAEEVQ